VSLSTSPRPNHYLSLSPFLTSLHLLVGPLIVRHGGWLLCVRRSLAAAEREALVGCRRPLLAGSRVVGAKERASKCEHVRLRL